MIDELPDPLVPADVDLRNFPCMPMNIIRLFGSEFHAMADDAEWRAGLTLWLKSWHQQPAGSLPDDDVALCRLAELGRDVKAWKKVRPNAMRGWVKCSDGRLYHRFIAGLVMDAWERRTRERRKRETDAERLKKWRASRDETDDETDDETRFNAATSQRERRGEERIRESIPQTPKGGDGSPTVDAEFEAWYAKYPRHVGRGQALKAYRKARKKPGVTAESLLSAAESFRVTVAGKDPEFIPHPATWLNGERWADDRLNHANANEKPRPQASVLFLDPKY